MEGDFFGCLGPPARRREIEAMWRHLYRVAYAWCHDPHLAADLVQETLAKALKKQHQLRDRAALRGWLFAILVNGWRDHCRRARERPETESIASESEPATEPAAEGIEILDRVRRAVAALSPEHREVLTLVALEGMAYDEAARALAIPIGTVTSRLCRAREILRRRLGGADSAVPVLALRRVK